MGRKKISLKVKLNENKIKRTRGSSGQADLQVRVGHFSPAGTLDDLNEGEDELAP